MSSLSPNLLSARRLAAASIAINCVLAASHILAGLQAGSTSVLAAGFEFLGDILASAVVFAGLHLAAKPPDDNHPYGYGRIEILAGLAVGLILAAGGAGISFRSLQRVAEIHPPPQPWSLWPLLAAICIRSIMSTVKFRAGRRLSSASLVADAWNDAIDILSALAALTALALTISNPSRFLQADHYGGFAVGLFVVYTGLRILRGASLELIDTMPAPEVIQQIRSSALEVPGVRGIEKCFARKTGLQHHVDIHVEVDPAITVAASHDIATAVRSHICKSIPTVADVLVHVEPYGLGDSPQR